MIEFEGRRSQKVLKDLRLEQYKSILSIFIVVLIAIISLLIWFGITKSLGGILASLFFLILTIILTLMFRLMLLSKNSLNKLYKVEQDNCTIVQINDEHFIYKDNYAKHMIRISKLTRIEDRGDYYAFSFKHMKHSGFVCQKDWISVGTIEEFESFFKDKLIVKTEKKKAK